VALTNDSTGTSPSTLMDKFQCRFHYPKRLCSQTRLSFTNPCFVEDKGPAKDDCIELTDINDNKSDVSNTPTLNVKKKGSQKRNLEFEFRRNHCMLNNYNELTALLWKGNHDVSPVCNPWGTAVYIAKYVTKAEESEDPALTDRIMRALTKLGENGNTNGSRIAAQIRAAGKADIGFHEFGLQEAVWLIMGRPLVEQSREIVKVDVGSRWCPTGEVTICNPNSEYDLLETDNVLANLDRNADGSNNKSIQHSLTKDRYAARIRHFHCAPSNDGKIAGAGSKRGLELAYQNRPAELEETNFHEFLSKYRGLEIRQSKENDGKHLTIEKSIRLRPGQMLVYIPDNLNGTKIPRLLIRRVREAVVYPTPRLDWDINTNQTCFAILLLYVPWREYDKIVINNDPVQTLQSKINNGLISEDIIQLIRHQKSISDSLKQDSIEREERRLKRMEEKAFEIRNIEEAQVDEDSDHDGEHLSLSECEAASENESEDERVEPKTSGGSVENSSSEIHECKEVSVRKYKALSRWLKDWVARRTKIERELIEARCQDVNMNREQRLDAQEMRNSLAMSAIQEMIDNLNELQRCAFKLIGNAVWRDPEMLFPNEQTPPLNLIILGSGGTGKSFFIKTLDGWIRMMYSMLPEIDANMTKQSNNFRVGAGNKKCHTKLRESMQYAPLLVLAFTGGAAYAVRGRTLHSAFGFNPKSVEKELSKDQKRNMRWRFLKVKVIVIDEISMVQADMLQRIDRRLKDLFPEFEKIPFGGRHMILCGDFYQLPPVCARGIYYRHPTDSNQGNKLYERFTKVIIFEQQQRQNNPMLISLLERARTGTITHEDIDLLNQRLIVDPRYNATCKILQPNELNSYNELENEEESEDNNNNSLYIEEEGQYDNNNNYSTDEKDYVQQSKYLDLKPPVNCMACTYTNAIADAHNMTTHIRSVTEGKKRLYRIWAVHTPNMKAQPAVDISNDSQLQINMNCSNNDKQAIVRKMPLVRSPMNASIKLALLRNTVFDSKGVNQKREKAKLSNCLNLNIGARVMLTHNMATTLGLVNGSMGIVKGFVYCKSSSEDKCNDRTWTATKMSQRENSHQLPVVLVKFDEEYFEHPGYCGENGVVPIYPIKEDIMYQGNSYRRTQLPLILAWSLTIHRIQGRTLDHLVVDPPKTGGNKLPPRGLMYVAISRVRQLKGLFLYSPLTVEMFNSQENDIQLVNREMERLMELHQQTIIEARSLPMPSTAPEQTQEEEIDIQ
jgi:ATP-dependent exoDNAse (exonuclease V) alpha subunit